MGYDQQTIGEFLSAIASRRVTPAGGSAAAVVGAIGTSLCEMACIHTEGKHGYEAVEEELADVRANLSRQRRSLVTLADVDAQVITEFREASEAAAKETAVLKTVGVPITIAEACSNGLDDAVVVTATANTNAVPDAGTGSYLVHSSLESCVFTARTNLARMEETPVTRRFHDRVAAIERSADTAFDQVIENIQPG